MSKALYTYRWEYDVKALDFWGYWKEQMVREIDSSTIAVLVYLGSLAVAGVVCIDGQPTFWRRVN